jgi:hypothetical protein
MPKLDWNVKQVPRAEMCLLVDQREEGGWGGKGMSIYYNLGLAVVRSAAIGDGTR